MSLEVLKSLRERLVENRSPAQNLVDFIISHSNSTSYLIGNLEDIVEALKADRAEENRVFQGRCPGQHKKGTDRRGGGTRSVRPVSRTMQ